MSIIHRLSLQQEYANWTYSDKLMSRAIWLREHSSNGNAHNAKTSYITTMPMRFNGKTSDFAFYMHDGESFESGDSIEQSLYPNTSIDNVGSQGNGGKLAGRLLVDNDENYCHIVYSNTVKNGRRIKYASIKDGVVTVESCDHLMKDLETIQDFNKYNVCYITRIDDHTKFKHHLQKINVMSLFSHIHPYWIESGRAIKFYDVHGNCDAHVISPSEFEEGYGCEKFTLKVDETKCKINERDIFISGRVVIDIYPGIYAANNLVRLRGKGIGLASRIHMMPHYNTYLVLDCLKDDNRTKRLGLDPCYAENLHTMTSSILQLRISNKVESRNDVGDFEEFEEAVSKSKNEEKKFKREPFAKVTIHIDGVRNGVHELRRVIPIDNFFMVGGRESRALIQEMLSGAVRTSANREAIKELRKRVDRYWINDNANRYGAINEAKATKINSLHFIKDDGSPLSWVEPGSKHFGNLIHPDGGKFDGRCEFGSEVPGNHLKHIGDNLWSLIIGDLREKLSDGSRPITKEEFIGLSSRRTYPKFDIEFENLGTLFTLNTRVKLPQRYSLPEGLKRRSDHGEGEKTCSSTDYIIPMEPPERYVSFYNGRLRVNSKNSVMDLLFLNVVGKESFRNKFYKQLVDISRRYWNDVISVLSIDGWGSAKSEINEELKEKWGNEYDQFLLNKLLEPLITSDRIIRIMEEIEKEENKMQVAEIEMNELPDSDL